MDKVELSNNTLYVNGVVSDIIVGDTCSAQVNQGSTTGFTNK